VSDGWTGDFQFCCPSIARRGYYRLRRWQSDQIVFYIIDLLDGLMTLMAAHDAVCDPVNIGNPVEFTINELAQTVRRAVGARSRVRHLDLPVYDPKQPKLDISMAQAVLGWAPKVSLAEGLGNTIPFFAQAAQTLVLAEWRRGQTYA
jgi:nucleoside-diphosphate-sugar epimerase